MCKLWAEVKKSASLNSLRHRKHPNVQKGCLCHSTSFYETVIHLSTASDKITLHLKNSPWWITVASNNCDKFQLQTSAETLVKYTVHMSCYHPPWSGTFINVLAKHTEHTATFQLHRGGWVTLRTYIFGWSIFSNHPTDVRHFICIAAMQALCKQLLSWVAHSEKTTEIRFDSWTS